VRWWLLLLCGCNQVFSLTETVSVDAQYFDAPPRQPPHCPAVGADLAFGPQLHQLHYFCVNYQVSSSADLAMTSCLENDRYQIFSGPADGPFTPVSELPQSTIDFDVSAPRLDPDGALLLISTFDLTNVVGELRVYHREGPVWVRDANVPNAPPAASNLSRGPGYRFLGTNGVSDVFEYAFAGGTWQRVTTHPLAMLQVPSVGSTWLSADALRMLFVADAFSVFDNRYMAYADRTSVDEPFGVARRLNLPILVDAYVTEDCGRLYFSGLHSIFYAESP
jgi:hypothetical protein